NVGTLASHAAVLADKAILAGHCTNAWVLKIGFQFLQCIYGNAGCNIGKDNDIALCFFNRSLLRVFFTQSFSSTHQSDASVSILANNLISSIIRTIGSDNQFQTCGIELNRQGILDLLADAGLLVVGGHN